MCLFCTYLLVRNTARHRQCTQGDFHRDSVQGAKPSGKYLPGCFVFTPLTPSCPPKYFSWSCSNTNFLHKILLAWRGSKQFPWLVPKTCFAVSCLLVLLFYQVPPNSQIPLLPEQQVTPVGKILLNLCFPVWRSCRNC